MLATNAKPQYLMSWEWNSTINYLTNCTFNIRNEINDEDSEGWEEGFWWFVFPREWTIMVTLILVPSWWSYYIWVWNILLCYCIYRPKSCKHVLGFISGLILTFVTPHFSPLHHQLKILMYSVCFTTKDLQISLNSHQLHFICSANHQILAC